MSKCNLLWRDAWQAGALVGVNKEKERERGGRQDERFGGTVLAIAPGAIRMPRVPKCLGALPEGAVLRVEC